ncbi:BMP family lipoprotein [Enterocloster lavalensis]|uniref:BMP family lipoprotein n=1 Tax=Enterocloster lavalensis TaxID=460384 RepID=UPI001D081572|nr:BMP family protein [Enterocloster lavalensis]MCB6342573.1 BMP family protein [Enterocloster lavalensis]
MFKKLASSIVLCAALSLSMVACSPSSSTTSANHADSSEGQAKNIKVAFVIAGSISDGAFGTISYQGVQQVKEEPFVERADFVEGVNAPTDAAKAIRDYVADGYDVVWAQSGLHSATVMEIAPEFPETVFVTLATAPADQTFENVWFGPNECEGGYYLAGALAAHMTESNTIGLVGGRENPLYVACAKAYEEGAHSVNPDIKVLSVFTGDYNDPIKAKEAAVSQIQSGADVFAHFQDLGMTGVVAAAEESTEAGKQVWVIGKGSDQYEQAPNVMLTSVIYDYGVQMKTIAREISNGKNNGVMPQSVANGSVYLADFRGHVPDDAVKAIDELTEKIKSGEVKYTTQYDIE